MNSQEMCNYLKCSISQLRERQKLLGIKGEGSGTIKKYTREEQAKLKAGAEFKDYYFVQDQERFFIWYGLSDINEIKIEL
jgi:hypothetical protein